MFFKILCLHALYVLRMWSNKEIVFKSMYVWLFQFEYLCWLQYATSYCKGKGKETQWRLVKHLAYCLSTIKLNHKRNKIHFKLIICILPCFDATGECFRLIRLEILSFHFSLLLWQFLRIMHLLNNNKWHI